MANEPHARILVVDDELTNIAIISDIFGDDYDVLFATEGNKAIEIATTEQPDIILLDILMPGIDGYEVCRRLKAERHTASIPVIFITALGDAEAEMQGLQIGAMDYVTKPFNAEVVKIRVKNQIKHNTEKHQAEKLSVFANHYRLTLAETRIIQHLMHQQSTKEIAEALCISVKTVRFHLSNLFSKTGATSQRTLIGLFHTHLSKP